MIGHFFWSILGAVASPILITATLHNAIETDLTTSSHQESAALAAEITRLLRWRMTVPQNLRRNDRITVLFERHWGSEPTLLFLDYRGQAASLQASRFIGTDLVPRYYDPAGNLIEPNLHKAPVWPYIQITDIVQEAHRGQRRHRGIDLKAPTGSPVHLPFAGKVTRINWHQRQNGNCIEIQYRHGIFAHFLHLATIGPKVRLGKKLSVHTLLGTVGSTGHSNAPHLHYEIIKNGYPIEPLVYHGSNKVRLSGHLRQIFQRHRNTYLALAHKSITKPAFGLAGDP